IINNDKVRIKEPGMKWTAKGKRKGQLKRLVEYGSFVIRVDRESTITNLERFLPKNVTKTIDRLSSSPGVLTSPISDDQPHDITVHSSNPNQEVTEHTPLIPESSSNSRRSSNIYVVPDIPTTYSYTRMPPHSEVYSAVHSHFAKSNCIAIFPEGTSHDNEHMLSLKYGCAVMSLGYLASNEPDASGNPRRLKLVPCGLNFFDRHSFRSRVFVDIGPTIEIDNELIEMYRAGDESKQEFKQLKWDTISYAHALRRHQLSLPHLSVKPISLILYLPLYLFLIVLTIPGLIFFCPIGLIAQYVGKKQGENTMLYDENSLAITRWPGRYVIATEREVFIFGSFLFFFFWTAVAYGTMLLWEGMRWVGKRTWVCMWSLAKPTKRMSYISRKEELSTSIWKWVESDN
ncbi:3067_t:CDS:2, partial [Cetraspora pellucida]